jgi:hypothetical protein
VRDIVSVITPQQTTRVLTEGLKMTFKNQQQEPKEQPTNQKRTDAVSIISNVIEMALMT